MINEKIENSSNSHCATSTPLSSVGSRQNACKLVLSYHAGYDNSFHFPDFQFRLLAESKDVRPLIMTPHLFRDGDFREPF